MLRLVRPIRTFSFIRPLLNEGSSRHSLRQEDGEVKIKVEPLPRINESTEKKRRRLLYQSRKRGILEADLLLSRFADKYLDTMTPSELEEYDKLLDEPDWDIYYWATKNYDVTPLPDKWKNSKILKQLQELSENKDNEILRMPDLK
ncbi:hypothetical protein KL905_002753 [Ogataea polymorpha]|uniref:Succinate dehydrogenase assembly factor 2, mitochondrial n=1 Tax=Ogataea polymorpha TaxID=460523 RepID=A0A1B7SNZ4_9ASCO|nr:uncharacterized protein OGAPODRAFT_45521 [Ogataea polymorpha]KAG7886320.1 hypothetical protein KL936_004998 [Ogataea polymorpha]KAG7894388.1 hypothetical protein KL908_001760 [Ogataea polymorpha]KAG7906857.1 hypothetical protein KL907_002497 [Ogataea polymorpha]KAG7910105.1 hypothetical protein KL906_002010 [Ogataea polymorpha]KAG7917805.1 hypothetical protein KL927_002548 [Ogataea polymorpha]